MTDRTNSYQNHDRYTGVAIGLHWLIAALIIGMLGIGKWMVGLEAEDPLRFNLTQWHKSFGIAILALSLFRWFWRRTHQAPQALDGPAWEKKAATLSHACFYLLLLAIPLSGWLLVSASPLNIPTVLFYTIPWPHIPLSGWAEQGFGLDDEQLTELFHLIHEILANALVVLLILHVGAALRHHFVLKDSTLARMSLFTASGKIASGLIPMVLVIAAIGAGVLLLNKATVKPIPTAIASGEVRFTAKLMGNELIGSFTNSEVTVTLDPERLEQGVLNANVMTQTLQSDDPQVAATLVKKDWFDTENFPQATFVSQVFSKTATGEIKVAGTLTIKDVSGPINFPITLETVDGKKQLTGGFTINRLDYQVGATDQPDDTYAGLMVRIAFIFALE